MKVETHDPARLDAAEKALQASLERDYLDIEPKEPGIWKWLLLATFAWVLLLAINYA